MIEMENVFFQLATLLCANCEILETNPDHERLHLTVKGGVGVGVMDKFAIIEDRIVSLSSRVTQRDEQTNRLP
jgi:hypothetical protein